MGRSYRSVEVIGLGKNRGSTCFTGTFEARNRGLFLLGVSTGGRISELLSLQIGDVYQNGKLATHSLRKSFAQCVYEESGDIYLVQELLSHNTEALSEGI